MSSSEAAMGGDQYVRSGECDLCRAHNKQTFDAVWNKLNGMDKRLWGLLVTFIGCLGTLIYIAGSLPKR